MSQLRSTERQRVHPQFAATAATHDQASGVNTASDSSALPSESVSRRGLTRTERHRTYPTRADFFQEITVQDRQVVFPRLDGQPGTRNALMVSATSSTSAAATPVMEPGMFLAPPSRKHSDQTSTFIGRVRRLTAPAHQQAIIQQPQAQHAQQAQQALRAWPPPPPPLPAADMQMQMPQAMPQQRENPSTAAGAKAQRERRFSAPEDFVAIRQVQRFFANRPEKFKFTVDDLWESSAKPSGRLAIEQERLCEELRREMEAEQRQIALASQAQAQAQAQAQVQAQAQAQGSSTAGFSVTSAGHELFSPDSHRRLSRRATIQYPPYPAAKPSIPPSSHQP